MSHSTSEEWEHVPSLSDRWPGFLDLMDTNPTAAMEGFYKFAEHMFQIAPPRIYNRVPVDDREDVFSEVVNHCIDRNFRKLRQYEPRSGATFAGWLATVAFRKISDWLKHEATFRKREVPNPVVGPTDSQPDIRREKEFADPAPGPASEWEARERESIFDSMIRKLGRRCRLLLRLRSRGFTNRQITQLLGLPLDQNKKVGTQLSDCRKKFVKLLRDDNYKLSDFVGPETA